MKFWLDEVTSGWCSFEKPCVFRPVKRSQNNTKKVRKNFPCLHAGRKTQHMAYACFSSKENQLPVSCWTSEFTSSTKTKTQWFFDCFLVRRSKHPHVFCLEIDWSKQHWPSMMSANPNIYWTQVSCNWTKHFAGNLSPGNVGLSK